MSQLSFRACYLDEEELIFYEIINKERIIPVVVLDNAEDAVPLAKALLAGGIHTMEITMRTDAAIDAIRTIKSEVPEIILGAGTVLHLSQAKEAVEAGATFLVSPGLNGEIVSYALENNVAIVPGVVTPTEIMRASSLGINTLKYFPAGQFGGAKTIKALGGPFRQTYFVPTGGVSPKNLTDYLELPNVTAVGGSWLSPGALIKEGKWEEITELCREALTLVSGIDKA